ncbi:KTSC domain-containing protein [Comamonas sp. CMM02]|nr:KTSC domain-containing protein [Comamonas sp. CMM02]
MSQMASAKTVQVKYQGPVSLDAFTCTDVHGDSNVNRICYDQKERYMVIKLDRTYYHYCEIDASTVAKLQSASSKNKFFQTNIRGNGNDGPFDCRTHLVPFKYRN